jgi:hypothetical protein
MASMVLIIVLLLVSMVHAFPKMGQTNSFSGPWELAIGTQSGDQDILFPIEITDRNKVGDLDISLPVMGTPINIKVNKYIPDLKWEFEGINEPNGGAVVSLKITGDNLNQEMWLDSSDPLRQSISSPIGGVALNSLYDPNTLSALVEELPVAKAFGVIWVWPNDSNIPYEFVARPSHTVEIPNSKYKLHVSQYMHHYSVDTETGKVQNLSDKPVNPAVKIKIEGVEKSVEQWLWSKHKSPHSEKKLPLRMKFADFDVRTSDGHYCLAAAPGAEPRLFFSKKGKIQSTKVESGKPYSFTNKNYSFSIDKIMTGARLRKYWKNNSEKVLHPAIIATIDDKDSKQETVLEFNQPFHYRTKSATMVLLFRRQPIKGH